MRTIEREDIETFAAQWTQSWNKRDIEQVLAHFHDDVEFTSPTAQAVVGTATVRGKQSLRDYWIKALARLQSLRFTVDRIMWDAARRELAIIYTSETDGKTKRVSENLTFDDAGKVVSAEVFHGVAS
ncbi:MAG TPA: nuclear transport factor 2 family protein [Thermoanaerobaculia bacterium]|nr:nuclear transport factor 2 family protein [Thermoanaerobaculia bacterium]